MDTFYPFQEKFESRHIGPDTQQIEDMLQEVNAGSLDELIYQTIPLPIRLKSPLNLPPAQSEYSFLHNFQQLLGKNKVYKSYIGQGYYGCITPPVILRNILENPGWYTAYTPYQAEISQGRLEALINFQTMIIDLSGMPIANASLLDEATAAAEAMHLFYASKKGHKKTARTFMVSNNIFPQTLDVLKTRATPLGIIIQEVDVNQVSWDNPDLFGAYIQNPNNDGLVQDLTTIITQAHDHDVQVAVGADIMSLLLVKSPGEMGADVVVGSTQRFGVPMGFGGPHAAYFAAKDEYKRLIPGRIIGASLDQHGHKAYRMALQTREQHIRREKATSNICTAQVLLGVMAGMYAVYHGPENLRKIATTIHGLAQKLNHWLDQMEIRQVNTSFFDTLKVKVSDSVMVKQMAESHQINFRYFDGNQIGITIDETTTFKDIETIAHILAQTEKKELKLQANQSELPSPNWPKGLMRETPYLTHPVFNSHHSEHEMLRYMKRLENKDLSMVHSMISLGSCTMKLNATTEMIPVTWPSLNQLHPFTPPSQTLGYQEMIQQLESWLKEITGFTGISLQPNSGAQGEYAGLMTIHAYHKFHKQEHRNIALIPASAHGTNPASAVMAGMKVVVVKSMEDGTIDINDLKEKATQHQDQLSCLMVTYPSTHGVFEESIIAICDIIHDGGGLVYMDGANMNAQVGLTSPANIGADVCHLNLHKTFCIPHGGGGPGMGPICVNDKLKPFLPNHPVVDLHHSDGITAVSAAPWGSASILAISYAYIALMGSEGLTQATKIAILNANYIKEQLSQHYKILYTGINNRCAHEMILDCRDFKKWGVEVEDIAKRLMDYGFHAPTVSFPVAGTLMIEPTESEPKEELDRFCQALIEIRNEIKEIEDGTYDQSNNVLKHAPHTAQLIMSDQWDRPYSRRKAAYPLPYLVESKFWPSVSRIDNAYGDRNLVCSCLPIGAYEENEQPVSS